MKAWKPNKASAQVLLSAQRVLNEYQFPITFKQLYYRLIAEGVIENSQSKYRMLNNLITNARKHGRLNPSLFVPAAPLHRVDVSVENYLQTCANLYHIDRTKTQKNYVEIWVEKNTVHHFVSHLMAQYDVPVYVSQGHSNYSFAYQAYERLRLAAQSGKVPRVIFLMDLCVSSFNNYEYFVQEMAALFKVSYNEMASVIFCQGVLPDHIVRYDLVEAPSSTNDRRVKPFEDRYGDLLESLGFPRTPRIELEAIDPKDLRALIYNTIFGILDYSQMLSIEKREHDDKELLKSLISG